MIEYPLPISHLPPVGDADEAGDDDGGRDGGQDEPEHQSDRPGETHAEVGENSHGGRFHKAEIRRESIGVELVMCVLHSSFYFTLYFFHLIVDRSVAN